MSLRALATTLAAALMLAGAAHAAAKPHVRLYAMDCGKLTMANADGFSDDGAYKGVPATMIVPCYLIRHPKGDLVWDTGVPQSIADVRIPHRNIDLLHHDNAQGVVAHHTAQSFVTVHHQS